MTQEELTACLALFGTYRGERVRQLEVDEFARLYGRAERSDVEAAIRSAAERDGRVFLETIARRHHEIRAAEFARRVAEHDAQKRAVAGRPNYQKPGWPCADGSPIGNYLRWVAVRAMLDVGAARATALRYERSGLMLIDLSDRILAMVQPIGAVPWQTRSKLVGDEIEAIEREIGRWASVEASQFVTWVAREREREAVGIEREAAK